MQHFRSFLHPSSRHRPHPSCPVIKRKMFGKVKVNLRPKNARTLAIHSAVLTLMSSSSSSPSHLLTAAGITFCVGASSLTLSSARFSGRVKIVGRT